MFKASHGLGIDAFWAQAGLPSLEACLREPEKHYRWAFDFDAPYSKEDQAATHGGTIEFDWTLTQGNSTGDCDTSATDPCGVWQVKSEGASKFDMAQIQMDSDLHKVVAATRYGMVYRYKVDDIANAGYFVGLAESGCSAIQTSGDFTTKDYIGHGADTTTEGTSLYFCYNDAGATEGAVVTAPLRTITDDTYLWGGFVCEGISWARHWANGIWSTAVVITDLPPVGTLLAPLIASTDTGTNKDTIVSIDFMEFRGFQDRWY